MTGTRVLPVTSTNQLPAGGASSAKQDTGNASLANIDSKVATSAKQDTGNASLASIDSKLSQNLTTVLTPPITSSGTISSAYVSGLAQVSLGVTGIYTTCVFHLSTNNFTGTVLFVYSFDGVSWFPMFTQKTDSFGATPVSTYAFFAHTVTYAAMGNIPAGATYIGINVYPYTSGSVTCNIYATANTSLNIVSTQSFLLPSNNRIGFFAHSGISYNDSIVPVNANQTIISGTKITYNTQAGTAWNVSSSYGNKFRAAAGADVAGTLVVEMSYTNNANDWYPLATATLAQMGGSTNYGAMIEIACIGLYMRARLVNGASNQTKVYLATNILA